MRESMWGIFIIVIGAVGIIAINLFQRLTVTDANTYVLMKESTKAAMYDSIDITYFRNTGNVKIIEEKFVENFTRRFAESAVINTNYKIVVHDIVEYPPKVSLSILTDLDDMKNNEYKVLQTVDSIFETVYSRAEFYGRFGVHSEVWFPGSQIWDSTPIDPVEENFCKNAKTGLDECISGDLQFSRWEELERTVLQVCDTELGKLGPKDRDAFYHECICGKWSEEKFKTINSGRPRIKDGVATYTWHFTEDGPVNDIDETVTDKIIGENDDRPCSRDLKILIEDDLPGTTWGGVLCPPEGITIFVGQKQDLYPRYIPVDAVNRNLDWEKNNDHISMGEFSDINFFFPAKDYVTIEGNTVGDTLVSAVPVENPTGIKPATCLVKVRADIPDFECPSNINVYVGSTFEPTIIKGEDFPVSSKISYSLPNQPYASYNSSNNLIRGLSKGNTYYNVEVESAGKKYPKKCDFSVIEIPPPKKVYSANCPITPVTIQTFEESDKAIVDNPHSFPILNYSVKNEDIISINSSGVIKVENRPEDDRFLTYEVTFGSKNAKGQTFDGENPIRCKVVVKGIDPREEGECDVGQIRPLWGYASYNMKNICITTVNNGTEDVNLYFRGSTVDVPVMQCGKKGTITSGCRGSWTTEVFTYKADSVFMKPFSYYAIFNPIYIYENWQKAAVDYSCITDRAEVPLGRNTSDSVAYYKEGTPQCNHVFCDPADGGCSNDIKVISFEYPKEVLPGVGSYSVKFKYTINTLDPGAYTSSCILDPLTGKGTLSRISDGIYTYTPPAKVSNIENDSVNIICQVDQYPDTQETRNVKISNGKCLGFDVKTSRPYMVSDSNKPLYRSVDLSLTFDKEDAYNKLAIFQRLKGPIKELPSDTRDSVTAYATDGGSGKAKVVATRQAQGACQEIYAYSDEITVCTKQKADYTCEDKNYPETIGEDCYKSDFKPLVCNKDTEYAHDGKCYTIKDLPNRTYVAPDCSSGTLMVPYGASCSAQGCSAYFCGTDQVYRTVCNNSDYEYRLISYCYKSKQKMSEKNCTVIGGTLSDGYCYYNGSELASYPSEAQRALNGNYYNTAEMTDEKYVCVKDGKTGTPIYNKCIYDNTPSVEPSACEDKNRVIVTYDKKAQCAINDTIDATLERCK